MESYFLRVPGLFFGSWKWSSMGSGCILDPKTKVLCQPPGVIFRSGSGLLFGYIFFEVLGLFRNLLGVLLDLLKLFGRPLDPKKYGFTMGKLHFLKMQLFRSLRLLMALLGSSCPLLGPIWSQMAPKMAPKVGPKSVQKVNQKMTPKKNEKGLILGSKNERSGGHFFCIFLYSSRDDDERDDAALDLGFTVISKTSVLPRQN